MGIRHIERFKHLKRNRCSYGALIRNQLPNEYNVRNAEHQ